MTEPIRIVLVDDQELVRIGLERIFGAEPDIEVVGGCSDGTEAVAATLGHRPDVVIMDVRMKGMDGIDATRTIRDSEPEVRDTPILVLTTFDDDDLLWAAIDAGATGYALKESSAEELLRAVRTLAAGAAWLDPAVTPRVLSMYRSTVLPQARQAARAEQLSDRENDVLRAMASGATNSEIASALFISEATVKSHVGTVFAKLGVRDRAGAIVFAYEHGIVPR